MWKTNGVCRERRMSRSAEPVSNYYRIILERTFRKSWHGTFLFNRPRSNLTLILNWFLTFISKRFRFKAEIFNIKVYSCKSYFIPITKRMRISCSCLKGATNAKTLKQLNSRSFYCFNYFIRLVWICKMHR